MARSEQVSKLKLVTTYVENDKNVTRSKTYTNVKADATDDGMVAAGTAIGNLMQHMPTSIRRIDECIVTA